LAHNLKLSNSAIVISSCRAFFLFVRRPVGYIIREEENYTGEGDTPKK